MGVHINGRDIKEEPVAAGLSRLLLGPPHQRPSHPAPRESSETAT